jgi:hypothetical protein
MIFLFFGSSLVWPWSFFKKKQISLHIALNDDLTFMNWFALLSFSLS